MPDNKSDIEHFIRETLEGHINSSKIAIGDPALIPEIQDALVKGSQGMFLWVALQIQTLYVIWKARGLTAAPDPSEEEIRYRDRLRECRDRFLERLVEFVVGTQSNTAEGVRRAVCHSYCLLDI